MFDPSLDIGFGFSKNTLRKDGESAAQGFGDAHFMQPAQAQSAAPLDRADGASSNRCSGISKNPICGKNPLPKASRRSHCVAVLRWRRKHEPEADLSE